MYIKEGIESSGYGIFVDGSVTATLGSGITAKSVSSTSENGI